MKNGVLPNNEVAMMKIKICGITNEDDAGIAISCGADFLGFIFVPASPRSVAPGVARQVIQNARGKVKAVGVFRDSPLDLVMDVAVEAGLDCVQLHGSEAPEVCADARARIGKPVIKALEIASEKDLAVDVSRYRGAVDYLLFDRPKGSTEPEWLTMAVGKVMEIGSSIDVPYFFAGGLNPFNVSDVVRRIKPFAVDVASGVESEPGRKDHVKLQEF
ncbi:MAG TPA: phosphoribosylanthranilate isomerase, partial [Candidatus Obscuribacterales bacterium]